MNQKFLDSLALVSFVLGVANYDENLSQSDKDDIMEKFDKQTREMIERLEIDLEAQNEILRHQNKMLEEILKRLE